MSRFSYYHPFVSFAYFASVLVFTMFFANPLMYAIGLLGASVCLLKLKKGAFSIKAFMLYVAMFLLVSLTNPLFSHKGVTVLFFLNQNPVTLEAIAYGVGLGMMLLAVILWFSCFNLIITEDKILYLFGRLSPKLALVLSSALRFVPMLKRQSQAIRQGQRAAGMLKVKGTYNKLKANLKVYSALISWSLESAVTTAASMKARGYSLRGRTSFSLYKFKSADVLLLVFVFLADALMVEAALMGCLSFEFYPQISFAPFSVTGVVAVSAFLLLCFLPFIIEVKEDLAWKFYSSRI